ncbi:MAG: TM2 domain-containing protein [Saprospiraceae bacterium]|nr:TM2 domain-containing protein [Saprospiraceae bacterium]
MKKLFVVVILSLFATSFTYANVNSYKINDASVEAMFTNVEEVDFSTLDLTSPFLPDYTNTAELSGRKNAWVAWILTGTVSFGICGIHRLYLGTEVIVFIGYLCTAGGCGILQTVDWFLLLIGAINDDIRKYENNSKFFMWM